MEDTKNTFFTMLEASNSKEFILASLLFSGSIALYYYFTSTPVSVPVNLAPELAVDNNEGINIFPELSFRPNRFIGNFEEAALDFNNYVKLITVRPLDDLMPGYIANLNLFNQLAQDLNYDIMYCRYGTTDLSSGWHHHNLLHYVMLFVVPQNRYVYLLKLSRALYSDAEHQEAFFNSSYNFSMHYTDPIIQQAILLPVI